MNQQGKSGDRIRARIGDVRDSQVAIGKHIDQHHVSGEAEAPTADEMAQLRQMLEQLQARVAAEVPPEEQQAALSKLADLEEAVAQPEPDLATMESVRNWFARRLPTLAGSVAGVVVHPIVGKLVAAAGDALAAEFRRRFGGSVPPE
jgi:hypothetical protein